MPYTAKFSRRFYEKLGDQVVNELVDWLNTVDLTYKSELKEINGIYLKRVEALIAGESSRLEAKFDVQVATLRGEMEAGFASVRGEMEAGSASMRGEFRSEMAAMRTDMIKWMFVFWATSALIMIGLA
jgi:hypothetical protein